MKTIIIYILVSITFLGCIIGKTNFNIKPNKNSKISTNLRLDGVYVRSIDSIVNDKRFSIFFLYNNGVLLCYTCRMDSTNKINSTSIINSINQEISFAKMNYHGKMMGGGFEIKGNTITLQYLGYSHYGKYEIVDHEGEIKNNTIIHISTCKIGKVYEPDKCPHNFYLTFLQMPKPDSTNQWMDKDWYWSKE